MLTKEERDELLALWRLGKVGYPYYMQQHEAGEVVTEESYAVFLVKATGCKWDMAIKSYDWTCKAFVLDQFERGEF